MASSEPAATLLESLPARPPTPPREAGHEAEVSVKSLLGRGGSLDPRLSLQTPPSASQASSAAADSYPSSSRTRKKVEWSTHTEYKEPPDYRGTGGPNRSSPASAPSSASSKPVKGILKQSSSPNPLASSLSHDLNGPANQANIAEMLDSTIKQLAGSDRDSRLDAYMMLARALKVSNNLPDRVALQDKMSLFMQFIQRDITAKNATGNIDSSLVNHALNLLATFLHFPAVASTLTSEFGVSLIDHSIRCFEDTSMPKDVVRHFMQVIAFQNFPPKVMTSDRVGRLIAALHRIEDHLKGKSIVMSRIHIYKRLIKQSRTYMAVHSDWLSDVLTDMLSTIRDIRSQAIALGTEAGFALHSDKQVMRKAMEILQTTNEDGQAYIEFYIHRLSEMLKNKQSSSAVPEIWSVVILFLRCPLERWTYYSPWLRLVQDAFNTTDGQTKQEANYAWNRYVYLSLLEGKVSQKLLQILCQPLLSQLRRKLNPKHLDEGIKRRRAVIGGACNLYYYVFRPGNVKADPGLLWDFAVQPVMSQLIRPDGNGETPADGLTQACRMVVGLLDVSTPRVWREDRIVDLPPVKPDELPSIDSKWVRRNCHKVFQAAGPILEKKFVDLANKESLIYRLWQSLVGSVTAASAKDIKVSEDTVKFFACSFGLLSRVWSQGCPDGDGSLNARFLPSARNFVALIVDGLGALPFTEKKLSMTVPNIFEPVETPSHRPDRPEKPRGIIRTPLHHLFSMLSSVPSGGEDNEDLAEFVDSVFEPFLNGKSPKSRGEQVCELLELLPQNSLSPFAPWVLAARSARSNLGQMAASSSSPSGNDQPLGPEYREIVSLLERGLTSHPNLPSHHWFALFDALATHVVEGFGDAGRAMVLIEPLAKQLLENSFGNSARPSKVSVEAAQVLFNLAQMPRDRQAVEVARRRLWGVPASVTRGAVFDPFDNLYKLGNHGLQIVYDRLREFDLGTEVAPFFEAVGGFMARTFAQTAMDTLSKTQLGLCAWIQDEKALLRINDEEPLPRALRQLWDRICAGLLSHGRLDKNRLDQIEPLLAAGFKSKHRFMVNKAAETWNALVKDEDRLECSESLISILSSLRSKVDLVLPGVEQLSGDFGAQAPSFIESQDETSFDVSSTTSSSRNVQQPLAPVAANSMATSRSSKKRRRGETPEPTRPRSSRRKTTPRPRHDNSQIQFAPITSSSPLNEESQHLTERQKEVRERQRENAAMYSDLRSSSPAHAAQQTAPGGPKASPSVDSGQQQKATPERATSYEDMISSTPTPRRGQVLQIDGYNDPPSSPPEPRPYPLLSEIQSRSRASSSLDNWEFSSPPGSPVTSRQQVAHDAEPPQLLLTNDSSQNRAAAPAIEQGVTREQEASAMKVIPSSIGTGEGNNTSHEGSNMVTEAAEPPSTPPHPPATTRQHDVSRSADELVDAASSPADGQEAMGDAHSQAKDASFAFSEGDVSVFTRVAVDLESKRNAEPLTRDAPALPEKKETSTEGIQDCITVSSSPPRRSKRKSQRSASPMVPSTPIDDGSSAAEAEPKRGKRKRGRTNQPGGRGKTSRSVGSDAHRVDDNQDRSGEKSGSSPALPGAMRMPQRCLGLKARRSAPAEQKGRAVPGAGHQAGNDGHASDDRAEDNTDEELLSQLMTESNAASQSQSVTSENVAERLGPAEHAATDEKMTERDHQLQGVAASKEQAKNKKGAATLLAELQGGVEWLRQASLSRDDVFKMEEVLMSMKRELLEAEKRGRD